MHVCCLLEADEASALYTGECKRMQQFSNGVKCTGQDRTEERTEESRQRRADRGDAKDPPKKWQLTLVEESGQRGRCRDKAEGGGNAQDNGEHRRGKRPAQEAVKDAPR